VILDTRGNIFGGFTPVKWDPTSGSRADPSLKSFLFTLKNPHNVPARRFALKAEKKDNAIFCDSNWSPHFYDLCVLDNCNSNSNNWTNFGHNYTNDTGLDGSIFFAGSPDFRVKEIEVFEIVDSPAGQSLLSGIGTWHNLGLAPRRLESRAFWDFPAIFDEFREKQFTLLWRGSGDGFGWTDFHSRCDGHPNTLTVILDTKGNIFGGFTPVEWEWRVPKYAYWDKESYKADPSLKSFLFTLKNPHDVSARRFALKAEKKDLAIHCRSNWGPIFLDIDVHDNCNTDTNSSTFGFGYAYTNDTGLDGKTFFTGSHGFQVKEIEVFEITE
jgi:hypothetical protein